MQSMTGFGRMELNEDGRRMIVEIKSVNNRFLDMNIRAPKVLSPLEETIRNMIRDSISRGHVDVYVTYENTRPDSKEVKSDPGLAAAYRKAMEEIAEASGLAETVSLRQLISMDGVLTVTERADDMDAVTDLLTRTLSGALEMFCAFRSREGLRLEQDLREHLAVMREGTRSVEERIPQVLADYKARLTERVAELVGDSSMDPARIATEVAIMADKAAVDEELTRLDSHLTQIAEAMELTVPVGRKLDFLVQELNREVNTICSKSVDLSVTDTGLLLKNEIEKIREQVQNIE